MSAPAVAELTRRWWEDLPELYRAADEERSEGDDGMPLLRFLSLLGDQAGELEQLVDRILPHLVEGRWISELTDPGLADEAWLGWLAQLAAVQPPLGTGSAESYAQVILDFPTYGDVEALGTYAVLARHGQDITDAGPGPGEVRDLLANAAAARRVGSTAAWEAAITPLLTGTQTVLHERIFGGDPWHLRFETFAAETPSPAAVAAAIAQVRRPAGLLVTYELYGADYQTIVDDFATHAAVDAAFADFEAMRAYEPI